jgi:diaminohydroxyphosphoribosylaminopyrimidine deaminase / 5-amino-6-(5-phosphoribosylamino)uracil reductase
MDRDQVYMNQALELARLGLGTVAPNPLVGALIVKNDVVIASGFHKRAGGPHAEIVAFEQARESLEGATLYCTLEPCCHSKKRTPPCTEAIIKNGIERVVIASLDPNPLVSGRGVEQLMNAGIKVEVGILGEQSQELNKVFNKFMMTGLPYIHLKIAQTLDGKIADSVGGSKWISDDMARLEVHSLRFEYDAVMIGRNTLEQDDPSLTIRNIDSRGKTPKRIVFGDMEKMDLSKKVFTDDNREQTILLTTTKPADKPREFQVVYCESLKDGLTKLGERGITSVLVEGGAALHSEFIDQRLFDELTVYVAPILLGNGKCFYENSSRLISDALRAQEFSMKTVGNQIRIDIRSKDLL